MLYVRDNLIKAVLVIVLLMVAFGCNWESKSLDELANEKTPITESHDRSVRNDQNSAGLEGEERGVR